MAPPTLQFASSGNHDSILSWPTDQVSDTKPAPECSPTTSCILGLGTANPENCYKMEDFGAQCLKVFGYDTMPAAQTFTDRICKMSGITQKHMACTVEIYQKHPSLLVYRDSNLAERQAIYEPEAMRISTLAAEKALTDWGGDRAQITHLVSYSTTMLLSPSLDLRLVASLGLQPSVKHFCVSVMGCHSGVTGIQTAAEIAQADARNRVLVVFVEISSVGAQTLNPESPFADLSPFLLNLLFGDGAGAVVVGRGPVARERAVFEVHGARTFLVPGTMGCIGAKMVESGLHTTLEKNVPLVVGENVSGFVRELLRGTGLGFGGVNWAVHPGGKAIVDAVEKNCKLDAGQLRVSRHILENYGNMGSATVLFLLDKFRNDKKGGVRTVHPWTAAVAFGPGVTVEGLLLKFGA